MTSSINFTTYAGYEIPLGKGPILGYADAGNIRFEYEGSDDPTAVSNGTFGIQGLSLLVSCTTVKNIGYPSPYNDPYYDNNLSYTWDLLNSVGVVVLRIVNNAINGNLLTKTNAFCGVDLEVYGSSLKITNLNSALTGYKFRCCVYGTKRQLFPTSNANCGYDISNLTDLFGKGRTYQIDFWNVKQIIISPLTLLHANADEKDHGYSLWSTSSSVGVITDGIPYLGDVVLSGNSTSDTITVAYDSVVNITGSIPDLWKVTAEVQDSRKYFILRVWVTDVKSVSFDYSYGFTGSVGSTTVGISGATGKYVRIYTDLIIDPVNGDYIKIKMGVVDSQNATPTWNSLSSLPNESFLTLHTHSLADQQGITKSTKLQIIAGRAYLATSTTTSVMNVWGVEIHSGVPVERFIYADRNSYELAATVFSTVPFAQFPIVSYKWEKSSDNVTWQNVQRSSESSGPFYDSPKPNPNGWTLRMTTRNANPAPWSLGYNPATLILIDFTDAGYYRLTVTNSVGHTASGIRYIPVVYKNPTCSISLLDSLYGASYIKTGDNVQFDCQASALGTDASTLKYQWQKNGVDIPTATSSSYIINNIPLFLHNGYLTCKVTSSVSGLYTISNVLNVNVSDVIVTSQGSLQFVLLGSTVYLRLIFVIPQQYYNQARVEYINGSTGLAVPEIANKRTYSLFPYSIGGSRSFVSTIKIENYQATDGNTLYQYLIHASAPYPIGLKIKFYNSENDYNNNISSFRRDPEGNDFGRLVTSVAPTWVTAADYLPLYGPEGDLSGQKELNTIVGVTATLSVRANGYGVEYEWYKNGIKIDGETGRTFSFTPTDYTSNKYYAIAFNSAGRIKSYEPYTIVYRKPTITTQPQDVYAFTGNTASFECISTDTPNVLNNTSSLDYTWQELVGGIWVNKSWGDYLGTSSAKTDIIDINHGVFIIKNVTVLKARRFRLKLTPSFGNPFEVYSSEFVLYAADASTFNVSGLTLNPPTDGITARQTRVERAGTVKSYDISSYTTSSNVNMTLNVTNALSYDWNLGTLSNSLPLSSLGSSPYTFTVKNRYGVNKSVTVTITDSGKTINITPIIDLDYSINSYAYAFAGRNGLAKTTAIAFTAIDSSNSISITNQLNNGSDVASSDSVQEKAQTYSLNVYYTSKYTGYSYQWKKNGVNITRGAASDQKTSINLTIDNIVFSDAAIYTLVMTDKFGNVSTSANHTLIVNFNPPVVTVDLNAKYNFTVGNSIYLFINASDDYALSYQWQKLVSGSWQNISGQTTNSLSISNAQISNSTDYKIIITNAYGLSVNRTCTVSVSNSPVLITTNLLSNYYVYLGTSSFTLSVTATGTTGYTYKWYKNGSLLSGQNNNSLILTNVISSDFASYYVTLSNSSTGDVVTSTTAVVSQFIAPSITAQPSNITGNLNLTGTRDTKSFSVTAVGPSLSYQWQKLNGISWANISAQTTNSLSIVIISSSDEADYRVVVSNSAGSITSNVVRLSLNIPPSITSQPINISANQGETISFSVTATGNPITYQWQKLNDAGSVWENINTATNSTYSITTDSSYVNAKYYRVAITNSAFSPALSITSNIVTLSIDNTKIFKINSLTLNSPSIDQVLITNTAGSSYALSAYVSASKTISMTLNTTGALAYDWSFGALNSNTIFTGTSKTIEIGATRYKAAQTVTLTVSNNTITISPIIDFDFTITAYAYSTADKKSSSKSCQIDFQAINTSVASITFPVQEINTNDSIIATNNYEIISYYTSKYAGFSYQWKKNGVNVTRGSVSTGTTVGGVTFVKLSLSNTITDDSGTYTLVMTDKFGNISTSLNHILTVSNAPLVFTASLPINTDVLLGQAINLNIAVASALSLTYQWKKDGNVLAGANTSNFQISSSTKNDIGVYLVTITDSSGRKITSSTNLNIINPVVIVQDLESFLGVNVGGTAEMSVLADNAESYQWYKNDIALFDKNSNSLILTNIQLSDYGDYKVLISNKFTSEISNTCTIGNGSPPTITVQPFASDLYNYISIPSTYVSLSVTATGTNLRYQWRKSGLNIGYATSSTYKRFISSIYDQDDYDVIVSNQYGSVTSDSVYIKVYSPCEIDTHPIDTEADEGSDTYLEVSVYGSEVKYQWQKSNSINGPWVDLPSKTNYLLPLENIAYVDEAYYRVKAYNAVNTIYSNLANLKINYISIIIQNPSDIILPVGSIATFSVIVYGLPGSTFTYQWKRNGIDMEGQTNSSLVLSNAQYPDEAIYTVSVSKTLGLVTNRILSTAAKLQLIYPPLISTQPQNIYAAIGSSISFNVRANGTDINYQWFYNNSSINGENNSSLNLINVQPNNLGNYKVVITNSAGSVTSNIVSLIAVNPPEIITQPQDITANLLDTVVFSITTNDVNFVYQWKKNGEVILNTTSLTNSSTLTLANITSLDKANYTVRVVNQLGVSVTSDIVNLNIINNSEESESTIVGSFLASKITDYTNYPVYISTGNTYSYNEYIPASHMIIDAQSDLVGKRLLNEDINQLDQFKYQSALENKISINSLIDIHFTGGLNNILNSTGENSYNIKVGSNIYSGCYLNKYDLTIRPFAPAILNADFNITQPIEIKSNISTTILSPAATNELSWSKNLNSGYYGYENDWAYTNTSIDFYTALGPTGANDATQIKVDYPVSNIITGYNYTASNSNSSTNAWEGISGNGGIPVGVLEDNKGYDIDFTGGFSFPFYGDNITNGVCIFTNGYVCLRKNSSLLSSNTNLNQAVNSLNNLITAPTIFAYFMDLNPHLGGNIYYKQIGTDRFIIEYLNVCSNSAFNPVTFQIVLKSNGEIYLRYKNFMNYVDTGNRGPYTAIRSYVGQPERINLTWSPSNNNNYTSWLFSPLKLVTTTSNGSIISSAARTINIKRTFSIYLKNVSGSGVVKYTLDGGVTWNSQNITSSWARYAFPSTTNRHKVGLKFETNGDIFQIWGAQLEEGGIVTDYIETDTFLRSRETIYSETPLNILGAINSDDAVDKSFIEFKVFKNGPLVGSRSLYSGPIINGRQSWGDINDNGDCIYFASSIQKWIFQYNHGDLLSQNSYSTSDASDPISCKWVVNKNDAIDNFVLNWGINRYSSNGIIDGGTCSVSGMSQVVSNVQSAIKYSVNCNRTASYSLSNKNSKKMFLDTVEKQLDISSTDLPSLIDYAGFQLNSNLGITLKNSSNIIGAIITMNTGSELLSQQFSVAESDILNTNVTIKEIIK